MTIPDCKYKHKDGGQCSRQSRISGFCGFHTPRGTLGSYSDQRYFLHLKVLLEKQDGDWRGFKFPIRLALNDFLVPISIDVSDAEIYGLSMEKAKFEGGICANNISVDSDLLIQRTEIIGNLLCEGSTFSENCHLSSLIVTGLLNFCNCKFKKSFKVTGKIGKANFNGSGFDQEAKFTATRTIELRTEAGLSITFGGGAKATLTVNKNLTKSQKIAIFFRTQYQFLKSYIRVAFSTAKKIIIKWCRDRWRNLKNLRRRLPHEREGVTVYPLFDGEAQFENVVFENPKKVLFQGVDLRLVTFGRTDVRDVSFVGNNWRQIELKRSGLFEDVKQRKVSNYYDKRDMLPSLENSYRNIRISLENTKDFSGANDFFIGEMEAQRKQLPFTKRILFSVNALYSIVSRYGTSPLRCFIWFLAFAGLHSFLISPYTDFQFGSSFLELNHILFAAPLENHKFDFDGLYASAEFLLGECFEIYTYSLQSMTLQKQKLDILTTSNVPLSLINLFFSVVGPILAALFALTVRTKIKRH